MNSQTPAALTKRSGRESLILSEMGSNGREIVTYEKRPMTLAGSAGSSAARAKLSRA